MPLCMGRATAVGALGAMLLRHTALRPITGRRSSMADVFSCAILHMLRGAMAVMSRLVLVRQYRALQARQDRRGTDSEEAAWWLYQ